MKKWRGDIRGKCLALAIGQVWKGVLEEEETTLKIVGFKKADKGDWPLVIFAIGEDLRVHHRTGAPAFLLGTLVE